jgi:hypothetical protein
MKAMAAVAALVLTTAASIAQEWREVPETFVFDGFRMTEFKARATESGCEGSQRFVKIDDPSRNGVSARRWTSATKIDGGTLCTGGSWYFAGTERPGGTEPDVLIKGEKFYRRQATTTSVAQGWQEIPSSFVNSEGFRITEFKARVVGSRCQGSQRYVKVDDPNRGGVSARRWTHATKADGGTVCSGGTWYLGGTNQPGGKEGDLLIKDGKFYRRAGS